MAVPILASKTEAVKAMFKTLKNEKWKEYDKSQKRAGIERERDFLQMTPMGGMVLMYIESKDIQKVFMTFAVSKDPFDVWVKEKSRKAQASISISHLPVLFQNC